MDSSNQKQVFVSYSHKDKRWLDIVLLNLTTYERDSGLTFKVWSDKDIQPGQLWREEIESALMRSSLAVLLVTQNFLASDFIARKELQPLLALAQKDGVQILWVAVSHSTVEDTVIASYQSLNNPDKPLDRLQKPQRNQELTRIAKKIYSIACDQPRNENAPQVWIGSNTAEPAPTTSGVTEPRVALQSLGQPLFRKHNFDVFPEIKEYIDQNRVQNATIIQMSCLNEMHVVRELWSTNATVEVYVSSGRKNFGVSAWQQNRVRRFLKELPNELQNIPCSGACGQIVVYKYDAPASIRAILIDDKVLTLGCYLYQKHQLNSRSKILDVRGGELPLMLLTKKDSDFEIVRNMLLRLIDNWKTERVVKLYKTYRHDDFSGAPPDLLRRSG